MRSNPLGAYRDVQALVSEPIHRREENPDAFSQTLAGVLPKPSPVAVRAQLNTASPLVRESAGESLPRPSLQDIILDPPQVPGQIAADTIDGTRSPEPEAPGVSAPTLVHAGRVHIADRYAGLSRGEKEEAVRQLVNEAGERHGIDPVLSFAVVAVESSFNHHAVSSDGHESKGLMQLLDSTGRAQLRLSEDGSGDTEKYDPFNPPLNIDLGVRYLRELHDMFAQPTKITRSIESVAAANSSALEKLAVAAYNAGQGRVASAQQRALAQGRDPSQYEQVRPYLPQSTQEYVERVMQRRQEYMQRFGPLGSGNLD